MPDHRAPDPAAPLAGFRIAVTAARKADEQAALLERRGAVVERAPALSAAVDQVDDAALRAATEDVLARPVDVLVTTTGVGVLAWFAAAERWGLLEPLLTHLARAEVLARGPKNVGALRRHGLRERWAPASERLDDVLAHLADRDLSGRRVVVQEHGQSLSTAVQALRDQGADVEVLTVYRVGSAEDPTPLSDLVDAVAERRLDAVTFTSAAAVTAFTDAADASGRGDEVVAALQAHVVACCVGPVTAAAFEPWGVLTLQPERSRLGALVRTMETELPSRRGARP